jgi:type IV secretory pathway VirJ component
LSGHPARAPRPHRALLLLFAVACTGVLAVQVVRHRPRWIDTPQLGTVRAFPAWFGQRGFVYVFSGASGWDAGDERVARNLALRGNYVAGLDAPQFLARLNRLHPGCLYLPGMLEDYSHAEQRAARTAHFSESLLLGHSVGGTLVYIAQLQAPALALRAAIGVDPEPRLGLQVPLCDHPARARSADALTLEPEALNRSVPARLLADRCASPEQRGFVAAVRRADPAGAPGAAADPLPTAPCQDYAGALAGIDAERERSGIDGLPIVEVPAAATATSPVFAIIYSGDGGWRDLDRTLADVLASRGISVVGIDVLRYYWRAKSPRTAAADLTRVIGYYRRSWQRPRVILIGFSFGADVLPFVIERLPADVRAELSLVSLLSPERTTAFEVEPRGWFGRPSRAGVPVEPALRRLGGLRVQCIYGADESDTSLCTTSAARVHEVVRKPGGHHFDQDYGQLATDILAAAH